VGLEEALVVGEPEVLPDTEGVKVSEAVLEGEPLLLLEREAPAGVADITRSGPDDGVVTCGGWWSCFAPNLAFARAELRRMHNQPGIVAESAVGFREKTQVPVPEELVPPDR
jgi:hypothetical protein